MGSATRQVAAFAAGLTYEVIPPGTRVRMKRHLLDSLGCGIYGTTLEHCQALVRVVEAMRGREEATVLGTGLRTSSVHAALANGTLISGFELDDVGVYVHPGACVVAAGLAAAERHGGVGGKRLLTALVIGYEVAVRVAECVGPLAELEVGWHTPPFHGALAAAACAGHVMGLTEEEMLRAISVAADVAGGGLMSARYGSDVKRLHCGRGAEGGVLAALLGRNGFTGTPDVLERDPWGYCSTLSYTGAGRRNYELAKLTDGLGTTFIGLDRMAIKYYPIGGDQHSIVENILALRREHAIAPERVAKVTIGVTRFAFQNKLRTPAENATTANFSARYSAAMALTHDMPPLSESPLLLTLWPEKYKDPAIVALQGRIEEVVDEELDRQNPYSVDTRVVVHLEDGRQLRRSTEWVRDAPSHGTIWLRQLSDGEVERKFRHLAGTVLRSDRVDELVTAVGELEAVSDVRRLARLATRE